MIQSLVINISFKPKVAIGSGGYVAGPAIWAASVMGAKIILIEQNSYPGVTTRLLERYASEVHLKLSGIKKIFEKRKDTSAYWKSSEKKSWQDGKDGSVKKIWVIR